MSELIISVSGLRGIVGNSLDPTIAMRYVAAFDHHMPSGPIILARDGRATGQVFADAIRSALVALGRQVIYADVAATPTVGILVRRNSAAGAVQISASHNPPEYNGIKLFGGDGRVVNADEGSAIKHIFLNQNPVWKPHDQFGSAANLEDNTSAHLEKVLKTIDQDAIRAKAFKVVLDSNNGSGSVLGQLLLESLGCEFQVLGNQADGLFSHPPEPTEANLQSVCHAALEFGANAVFCQDPDADRLAIIDETGRYIGEEMTLAITLQHALSSRQGPVVINCATSRMSVDIAESRNCECHIAAVGEANVTDKMIELEAVYGGEGNGGPIDPEVGYVRDSFVAMAQVLDAMAKQDRTISQLCSSIPSYSIVKDKIPLNPSSLAESYEKIKTRFSEANANEQDGLRLDWDDRWLLFRPSNTEPIARIIAEANSEENAKTLVAETKSIVAN